jgi:hypothetical protein
MNEKRGRNCMCKLMEEILVKDNLNQAYLQVFRNKGQDNHIKKQTSPK